MYVHIYVWRSAREKMKICHNPFSTQNIRFSHVLGFVTYLHPTYTEQGMAEFLIRRRTLNIYTYLPWVYPPRFRFKKVCVLRVSCLVLSSTSSSEDLTGVPTRYVAVSISILNIFPGLVTFVEGKLVEPIFLEHKLTLVCFSS